MNITPIRLLSCNLCDAHLASSDALSMHYVHHFAPGKCNTCFEPLIQIREKIYHLQLASTCTKTNGVLVKREPDTEENVRNPESGFPEHEEQLEKLNIISPDLESWPDISDTDSDDENQAKIIEYVEVKLEEDASPAKHVTRAPQSKEVTTTLSKKWTELNRKRPFRHRKSSGKPRKKPERRDPRIYECFICRRVCNHIANLKRHIERQHDRSLTCHLCNKNFAAHSYLRGHMKTHSDTKQFICSYCGKGIHFQILFRFLVKLYSIELSFSRCIKLS